MYVLLSLLLQQNPRVIYLIFGTSFALFVYSAWVEKIVYSLGYQTIPARSKEVDILFPVCAIRIVLP